MTAWWVNHKQTFWKEIEGQYLWSPTKNNDGSRNQTYLNLKKTRLRDTVFSYADGEIRAIGVVGHRCVESRRPVSFGESGKQWSEDGWLVKVLWTLLDKSIRPRDYLSSIVHLLPIKYSPIQQNGNGNQKFYLTEISDDLGNLLLSIASSLNLELSDLLVDSRSTALNDEEEERITKQRIPETEKRQLIKARRGQGLFRDKLTSIEKMCRLTGVRDLSFLTASHIKPWSVSDNVEKLDGNNGLLLSPHVDKLFDKGWISFSDKGDLLCSCDRAAIIMKSWGLSSTMNVGCFNQYQRRYLAY